jgi:gamma-tubulin complex component 2
MCEQVIKIRHFVKQQSRYEYGYISHAFCSAIKDILRDFDLLCCQLEFLLNTRHLSLQKLIFLLQPSKLTIYLLDKVIAHIKELHGGALLNQLYLFYLENTGDSKAKDLLKSLLINSFNPFLRILSKWIYRGILDDPYHEFMIKEDITLTKETLEEDFNAQYWDLRYTLDQQHIPQHIFSTEYTVKILNTGKYLNVVRDCLGDYAILSSSSANGGDQTASLRGMDSTEGASGGVLQISEIDGLLQEKELVLDLNLLGNTSSGSTSPAGDAEQDSSSGEDLKVAIDQAYTLSSKVLLQLLVRGYNLFTHLESLGKFFLLEHGDFFIQFMDIAEEDLRKEVKDITLVRLNHLLQLAISSSTLGNDNNKEELSCNLASHNLIQHLHLIQVIAFCLYLCDIILHYIKCIWYHLTLYLPSLHRWPERLRQARSIPPSHRKA